ncbi:MAG: helix-turn-helix transcriptional regulator [Anaerovoracaceae bacterium]
MKREWLIQKREENNLTQNALCKAAGMSQQYYSKIENGIRNPSISIAKKIAKVLGFDWTLFYE